MKKVLVLEDEFSIRLLIVHHLQRANYSVYEAETGKQALEIMQAEDNIAVALLDIMLPDMDGLEVCQQIRATNKEVGIIMLTARSQESDKINGFMNGADDYITKPFSPVELIARVDALYRRCGKAVGAMSKHFSLDPNAEIIEKDGEKVHLTNVEYRVLAYMMEHPNEVISREKIMKAIWKDSIQADDKIVDVNIRRIRKKIEEDAKEPRFLQTVWGEGYRWKD